MKLLCLKPAPAQPLRRMHRAGRLPLACLALSLSAMLGACSKPAEPASGTAAAPAYAAVARGRIDIAGGLLTLSMPREGTLTKVAVHEGDHVRKGQLLAQLDTEPARLGVEAAQAQLEQAQAQMKLLGIRLAAAKQRAQRLGAAVAAGAGDGQSADDAREAAAQLEAEQLGARASLGMASQKLEEARYELSQRSLRAPFDADVVRVSAQAGAAVSPNSGTLFTLLPQKPRIVRAELNESFVGAVHPGMHADVVPDNSGSGVHWSAHVLRIGQVYGPSTLENDPQVRANARTVECVLGFDQPQDLRIGQRVIVRFDGKPAPAVTASKD